ncbi:MAG TPA: apolipoprotein N-acyltransferase [Candidatus Acidoferrales bacterium]|nr:apolipoprotein N-acyltransferase [Candidatus Acidoferrales bacterium]
MLSSERLRAALLAALAGLLFALAFPRAGFAWAPPLGAGALFWTWQCASWKRALFLGWICGLVFFTISFWWWSTTIQTAVGALAYAAVVASAAIEALAIGLAGVMTAIASRRTAPALVPLAAACAFAITEWLRSIGPLGVPFAQLGVTQVETPLRALGAYVGTAGLTATVFCAGAYGAYALRARGARAFIACIAVIAIAAGAAWFAWPARRASAPVVPVVAVQGNIAQSLKWQPGSLTRAVDVYTAMTRAAIALHPRLIVWPETVIAISGAGLNGDPALVTRFTGLAAQADATLIVGSIHVVNGRYYNALYVFTGAGIMGIYDKRQLVPFAEYFPGQRFLWWLPAVGALNGDFTPGDGNGVYATSAGLPIGALVCWESAFGDLAYDEMRDGAQVLVVATDDAWFGTSSGPYQHAQIAQMRAIEAGAYVVRAAATGISGIIAPDGTWEARLPLDVPGNVAGRVGPAVGSFFARIGPTRVWFAFIAVYALLLVTGRRRDEEPAN